MALSNSGSISLSQIQTEYGGSNPISLNEYYNVGSFVLPNNSSTANSSTLGYNSVTGGSGKNTYPQNFAGWAHANLFDSSQAFETFSSPGDQTQSASIAKVSGADLAGNGGTIPSSGAVQFDHYRATNAGTNATFTCYGIGTQKIGSLGLTFLTICIGGHIGSATTYTGGDVDFNSCPFSTVSIPASGSFTASTATSSGSAANGSIAVRSGQSHHTATNVGAYTQFGYVLAQSHTFNSSGSLAVTFNF